MLTDAGGDDSHTTQGFKGSLMIGSIQLKAPVNFRSQVQVHSVPIIESEMRQNKGQGQVATVKASGDGHDPVNLQQ